MSASGASLGPPVLFVDDLAASIAFYLDVLGFEVAHQDDTSAVLRVGDDVVLLVTLDAGQELFAGRRPARPDPASPAFVLNLFVDDVDRAVAMAASRGAVVIVEPVDRPWGRRTAHLLDADGYVWELSQESG